MHTAKEGLGGLIRLWRDRLSPTDAGFAATEGRRASGLRREELASLAGLSVDYVVRLEQGRASHPSAQVVSALARALQLDTAERDHLYRAAGLVPPSNGRVSTQIPPSVQRLVARLGASPLAVFTADWTLTDWNPLWAALLGDPHTDWPEPRNLVRALFDPQHSPYLRREVVSANGPDHLGRALVADLRDALSNYPDDASLARLLDEMCERSDRFAEFWASGQVGRHESDHKTIMHPEVGEIRLDCDVVTVPGADLRIVIYSAAAGTVDADKLEFLRVTGGASATVASSPG